MKKILCLLMALLLPVSALAQVTISGLPAATVPLAGTELVPIVQSATTRIAPAYAFGPVTSVKVYGAKIDGVTDDTAAMTAAMTALSSAGGGRLYIPAGTMAISSNNCISGTPLFNVPGNVTIYGAGMGVTTIKVTGALQCDYLFQASTPNNVWFRDLSFYGNSVSICAGCGGLLSFVGPLGGNTPMANFGCLNCGVANDRHDYWIQVRNFSNAPMSHVRIIGLLAQSYSGNDRDPTSIGVPSDIVEFNGQLGNAGGTIDDVIVSDSWADGTWVKRFCSFWDGVTNAHCDRNKLYNFGANANSNTGSYATLAYDNNYFGIVGSTPPTNIWITDNSIISPFSAGLYSAGAINVFFDRNVCTGQADTGDTSLPKGCVAFNAVGGNSEIVGNVISSSYDNVSVYPAPGSVVTVAYNKISGSVANAVPDDGGVHPDGGTW